MTDLACLNIDPSKKVITNVQVLKINFNWQINCNWRKIAILVYKNNNRKIVIVTTKKCNAFESGTSCKKILFDKNECTLGWAKWKDNLFRICGQHIHGKKTPLKTSVRKKLWGEKTKLKYIPVATKKAVLYLGVLAEESSLSVLNKLTIA